LKKKNVLKICRVVTGESRRLADGLDRDTFEKCHDHRKEEKRFPSYSFL
jgi:hypothetical protein